MDPTKRLTCRYREEDMEAACEAVLRGKSLREAGREFGVPHSTLKARLGGRPPVRRKVSHLQVKLLTKPRNYEATSTTSCSQARDISYFDIPDPATVPSDMRELMETAKEKGGFVPNVFKVLSHRPAEMRAFVSYYDAVMENREGSHVTKADKEMIIVAVSSLNKCRYCIIAHSALCRIYSKNAILADQIAANWETADIDNRQRAILTFAMEVAQCHPLSDKHFEELYKHGLDKEDAWDIGSVVALFSLSNRMAFLTGMAPNEEFYMLGRIPKKPKD